jgi:hypothetical protein
LFLGEPDRSCCHHRPDPKLDIIVEDYKFEDKRSPEEAPVAVCFVMRIVVEVLQ